MKRLYAAVRRRSSDHERCELCAIELFADHEHLFAPATRTLKCACKACVLIIPTSEASPYRAIPRGSKQIAVDGIAAWLDRLGVPVGVAALVKRENPARITVNYPGPAGLVEADLSDDHWELLCAEVPAVADLEPEVEALVWSRLESSDGERVLRVGIDAVFRLIGELRQSWQGITGGLEGPAAVKRVLAELGAQA